MELKNNLYFSKVMDTAILPKKRLEDAGYDVYVGDRNKTLVIPPNDIIKINSGIATAFSSEYVGIYFDRSNMGKCNIKVCGGVIDSGYRGPHYLTLANLNSDKWIVFSVEPEDKILSMSNFNLKTNEFTLYISDETIPKDNCIIKDINKAIAQLILLPVPNMNLTTISYEKLQSLESERGIGWAGSSGK